MAAFNNGFPVSYPQMYMPYQAPSIQQPTNQGNGVIWIQGEAAAKSYLVAPNSSVVLFDSESQVIYLKSADASGMPSMKILDYTIRENGVQNAPVAASMHGANWATKEDVEGLTGQIRAIQQQIDAIKRGVPEA